MKYGFIEENKDIFSIDIMCSFFNVSRSGYYSWLNRAPSKRELANKELDQKIIAVSEHTKPIYDNILNRDFTTTKINHSGLEVQSIKCGINA